MLRVRTFCSFLRELANQLIEPDEPVGAVAGKIECRKRLDVMLRYYYRD